MKIIEFEGKEQYVCTGCGSIHEDPFNLDSIFGIEYCIDCADSLADREEVKNMGLILEFSNVEPF